MQRQRQIYCRRGRAASAFGVHHGENFASRSVSVHLPLRRCQPDKRFEKVGGCSWTFDVFARSGAHRAYDHLWLRHASDRKYDCASHFLVD
jgi:hypothetical protein